MTLHWRAHRNKKLLCEFTTIGFSKFCCLLFTNSLVLEEKLINILKTMFDNAILMLKIWVLYYSKHKKTLHQNMSLHVAMSRSTSTSTLNLMNRMKGNLRLCRADIFVGAGAKGAFTKLSMLFIMWPPNPFDLLT